MSQPVEWSVRGKIADLQAFLTSNACSDAALAEIDQRLDHVVEAMNEAKDKRKEVGGKT